MQLIQAPIHIETVHRWAGERGLVRDGRYDRGHAFHIILSSMFGKGRLQPFRIYGSDRQPYGAIYGYTDENAETLRVLAEEVGPPDCAAVINPAALQSKAMPEKIPTGRILGFDVLVRPVRRRQMPSKLHGGRVTTRELDVFGHGNDAFNDAGLTRDTTYQTWLNAQLRGTATILRSRIARYQRLATMRGDGQGPTGPDVTIHGDLRVNDPEGFNERIRRGLGRHKAYGYGMLLLRPPS